MNTADLKALLDAFAGLGAEAKQAAYAYFGMKALDSILGLIIVASILWLVRWAILHFSDTNAGLRRIAKALGRDSECPDFHDVERWIEQRARELQNVRSERDLLQKSCNDYSALAEKLKERVLAAEAEVVDLRARLFAKTKWGS